MNACSRRGQPRRNCALKHWTSPVGVDRRSKSCRLFPHISRFPPTRTGIITARDPHLTPPPTPRALFDTVSRLERHCAWTGTGVEWKETPCLSDLTRRIRAACPLLAVLAPAAALAAHPLVNNDLPMHLAIGDWIRIHGIPASDPFSGTAGSPPWVPHEWLAGVMFSWANSVAGETGLMLLAITLSVGIAGATYALARRVGSEPQDIAVWAMPAWIIVGPRIMLRPHLFFLLFIPVLWILLLSKRPKAWWLTVPLLALWGNIHGSFPLAMAVVLADLWIGTGRSLGWDRRGHTLRLIRMASVLATPLLHLHLYSQPTFWAGVRHAIELTGNPVFSTQIREWISPLSDPSFRRTLAFILVVPWLIPVAYGAWQRRRELPLTYLLFAGGMLYLFLDAQRFVAPLALFTLTLLPALPTVTSSGVRWARTSLPFLLTALLLTWGLPIGWRAVPGDPDTTVFAPPRTPGWGWYDGIQRLPLREVDSLVSDGYRGLVICEYQYGGVVAWRSGGSLKPSLDSRNSVYGATQYQELINMLEIAGIPEEAASRLPAAQRAPFLAARARLEVLLEEATAILLMDPDAYPSNAAVQTRRRFIQQLTLDPRWERVTLDPPVTMGPMLFRRRQ